MTEIAKPMAMQIDGPVGFGGWLILPTLGTFFAPILFIYGILQDASIYGQLNPQFRLLVQVEIAALSILAVTACAAIYFMLKKSAAYPKIYISILVGKVISSLIVIAMIGGFGAVGSQAFVSNLTQSVIVAAIWVPYMLVSKRVQNTFVN